jgi:hypothetical protein
MKSLAQGRPALTLKPGWLAPNLHLFSYGAVGLRLRVLRWLRWDKEAGGGS